MGQLVKRKLGIHHTVYPKADGTKALASRELKHDKRAYKVASESADSITDDMLVD